MNVTMPLFTDGYAPAVAATGKVYAAPPQLWRYSDATRDIYHHTGREV